MTGIRIFIGSGDASLLERKVLIYSLRKHTARPLEIWTYNGTRRVVESCSREIRDCSALLDVPNRGFVTEFSLFRYIIPELCGRRGKAIYLDSDMVCFTDIGELFDTDLTGADFAARPDAYPEIAPGRWALSALVMDCAHCHFDLPDIFRHITAGRFTYPEFAQMGCRAASYLHYNIQPLPDRWNSFDYHDASISLIHYTDLDRQPWKYRFHFHGEIWFRYFREAVETGFITDAEITESIASGYVRTDIREGNRGQNTTGQQVLGKLRSGRLAARDVVRRIAHFVKRTNV
ncbi:MAG: glycosyl transferase [Acidobacteria bacterium]|nr:glycosyl transferase [Acidobacteriota bacterium]